MPDEAAAILATLLETERDNSRDGSVCHALGQTKLVSKGWGSERWLVPENSPFGFKVILIEAGRRTSLQRHQVKDEANLVLSGCGVLIVDGPDEPARAVPLAAGTIARIRPNLVHRIEATTDLLIVEVSTPELDDVIRLQDDWQRPDGRIASEHSGTGGC